MRRFLGSFFAAAILLILPPGPGFAKPRVAFTFDDPNLANSPCATYQQKSEEMLAALKRHNLKAALFVCGKRVDSPEGIDLLKAWLAAGHLIGNHTYSHYYYHSNIPKEFFAQDFLKDDSLLRANGFAPKFFRFPYLKEGNTAEKRDFMRSELKSNGYSIGAVTIDASDWYFDEELNKAFAKDSNIDLTPFRNYYYHHIRDRANYYDNLAKALTGREIPHVILLHFNALNARFLDGLIDMFQSEGWETIDAEEAYKDKFYTEFHVDSLPAGESWVWSLARQTGKYEETLRYPGEDSEFEYKPFQKFLENRYVYDEIEVEKLSDDCFKFATFETIGEEPYPANSLLVRSGKEIALIDAPWSDYQADLINRKSIELFGKPITKAVFTHFHNDRVGGANFLLNMGVKCYTSKATAELAARDSVIITPGVFIPMENFDVMGVELYYPGAGHTTDNIVAYLTNEKILFGGCFVKSLESMSLGNLADADVKAWAASAKNLKTKYGTAKIVIPGHGEAGGPELIDRTLQLINIGK